MSGATITHAIVDFDGTCTDIFAEAPSFLAKHSELFAQALGVDSDTLAALISKTEQKLRASSANAWICNGYAVAPVIADPLVLRSAVASQLLEEIDCGLYPEIPKNWHVRQTLVSELFKRAHESMELLPRRETRSFLARLHQKCSVAIVSNTNPELLNAKICKLGITHGINIVGHARKYIVDDEWTTVPRTFQPRGVPRPIFLRRPHYGRVLEDLAKEGFRPDCTAVIGDIWELDLALPEFLNYTTIQLRTDGTPLYEVQRKRAPKSFFVPSLESACGLIRGKGL